MYIANQPEEYKMNGHVDRSFPLMCTSFNVEGEIQSKALYTPPSYLPLLSVMSLSLLTLHM